MGTMWDDLAETLEYHNPQLHRVDVDLDNMSFNQVPRAEDSDIPFSSVESHRTSRFAPTQEHRRLNVAVSERLGRLRDKAHNKYRDFLRHSRMGGETPREDVMAYSSALAMPEDSNGFTPATELRRENPANAPFYKRADQLYNRMMDANAGAAEMSPGRVADHVGRLRETIAAGEDAEAVGRATARLGRLGRMIGKSSLGVAATVGSYMGVHKVLDHLESSVEEAQGL